MSSQQVVFRTEKFWGSHQNVTFTAHLAGVRGLKGVYGTKDQSRSFKIGASNVSVASGALVGGSGTIGGTVTPASGAVVSPAGAGAVGTLTTGGLVLGTGSQVTFEFDSSNDQVSFAGLPGDFGTHLNATNQTITVTNSTHFSIAIDGTTYSAYTSGGTATRVTAPTNGGGGGGGGYGGGLLP